MSCKHRYFCIDSRAAEGYRYRVRVCDKCNHKQHTVEIEIPPPGSGRTMERRRAELMRKLTDRQCAVLLNFLEELHVVSDEG